VPLLIERVVAGSPYRSNGYLVRRGADGAAVAIDPGGDPGELLGALGGRSLAGILVTHGDIDHVAGVAGLAAATGAEVWVPAASAAALARGESRGGLPVAPHSAEHELAGGELIELAGVPFEVVATPGHAADHLAFHAEGSLFAGDLLFAGSVGRTDLDGGDFETLLRSVAVLLERFGPETTVYSGHGEPTTLGRELATNPFLTALRVH
jgi:glyoxylase-like metal-dependent hydrolase (beta-lactamase superfamily II)